MKKFLTMLLALVMVLSLAACSSQKGGDVNGGFPASAVDLLTAVWNAYPESEKFSVVGGSLDNPVDNAPALSRWTMPTIWTICYTSPPTNPISLTTPRR